MKTGLVLEGGAMRGIYSAGILDVLMENKIWVDGVVGVSAGACFGCNYKSEQIGRSIRYNKRFCRDKRYGTMYSFFRYGDVFESKFCYHDIPFIHDPIDLETYRKSPVDFYVTCTDVHTGEPFYHLSSDGGGEDVLWMQASASMPLVSKPVAIDGHLYLDGGVSDSVPVKWFRSIGYEKCVVILTREAGYRKRKPKFAALQRLALSKYPALAAAMDRRADMYNETLDLIEDLESRGEIFVFRPSKKPCINRTEHHPEKLQELYDLGRADALAALENLKSFLAEGSALPTAN